jgi:hypothetical protein
MVDECDATTKKADVNFGFEMSETLETPNIDEIIKGN